MGTTIEIDFLLGRYHATPWDTGANSGEVEWPPSPWRIMRALMATAYARCPELAPDDVILVLQRLGNPTAYQTWPTTVGSSRHYMPDLSQRSSNSGGTSLVIDAFRRLPQRDPSSSEPHLRIHWAATLDDGDKKLLSLVVDQLPYLGRSESVCTAAISPEAAIPDQHWWRLGAGGADIESVDLLGLEDDFDRGQLEATTMSVRRQRKLVPPGTRRLRYGRAPSSPPLAPRTPRPVVRGMAFQLHGTVPVRMRDFLVATDAMHMAIRYRLDKIDDQQVVSDLIGRDGNRQSRNNHSHIHIQPVPANSDWSAKSPLVGLVLWRHDGFTDDILNELTRLKRIYAPQHNPDAFPAQRLFLAGTGELATVAPDQASEALQWTSATPYLPVRHRHKNQTTASWIAGDIAHELRYRRLPAPTNVELLAGPYETAQLAAFRRRRLSEGISKQRRGVYVRFDLPSPIHGPVALGQLSHFGAGTFIPNRPAPPTPPTPA